MSLPPLHILIVNIWLLDRSGTETMVRDLALNLSRRGHAVTVFALKLGVPAAELRAAGITVMDDLARLAETPDVILGCHNVPVVLALAQFPSTPAIWLSQDWRFWYDLPPRLSRISELLAIDFPRRDFLARSLGLATSRIGLLHNAVDLSRIVPRPAALPDRPRRLLAFTKTSAQLDILRGVCADLGLEFAALGRGPDRAVANPEQELVEHDIVVATGRCAIESLASGCAVIVGDARGLAGMVTPDNFDQLRNLNFGSESFTEPLTAEAMVREIARYDRSQAELVSRSIRERAHLDQMLDALERIARRAVAGARRRRGWTPDDCRTLEQFVLHWPAPEQAPEWRFDRERARAETLRVGLERRFGGVPRVFLAVRDLWRKLQPARNRTNSRGAP